MQLKAAPLGKARIVVKDEQFEAVGYEHALPKRIVGGVTFALESHYANGVDAGDRLFAFLKRSLVERLSQGQMGRMGTRTWSLRHNTIGACSTPQHLTLI